MKTLLKVLGYGLAALVILVAALIGVVYVASNAKLKKTYAVTAQPVTVPTDATAIAQGRHLAETRGCMAFHGRDLAGATVFDNPAMGRADGPNITRGAGGLPGDWSDLDYMRAIRHGVAHDGRGLFLMPSTDYATFSQADMGALIAYLKSLPAVDKPRGPVAPGPVARALLLAGKIKLAAEVIDHVHVLPSVVTPAVTAEYGKYLAVACTGCHGENYSGGKIDIGPPDWPPAANLTPHAAGRLAKWSESDFLQALRTGRRPDGTALSAVMPKDFGKLDDTELKAIWLSLKTLPPVATGTR